MGSTVAATCSGERWWASEGRSAASRQRAEAAGLRDAGTVAELVERVDTIVSVCPPSSALDVARTVAAAGFTGVLVEANAVAPAQATDMAELFERFVDGGIVGPPATVAGTTRMYLSGPDATSVAERWAGSSLDVRVMQGPVGAASALKMSYAAWTKGQAALLLAVNALANTYGVDDTLRAEWDISQPGLEQRSAATAHGVAAKAWRFEGEMHEIAATLEAVDLPGDFHRGAAEIYRRMADLRHADNPTLDDVIDALERT